MNHILCLSSQIFPYQLFSCATVMVAPHQYGHVPSICQHIINSPHMVNPLRPKGMSPFTPNLRPNCMVPILKAYRPICMIPYMENTPYAWSAPIQLTSHVPTI